MKIWFMYSDHTFAKVEEFDRDSLIERSRVLFSQDGAGSMFVHDEHGATMVPSLTLHGKPLVKIDKYRWHYGVDFSDLEAWADKVIAERSFRTLMA